MTVSVSANINYTSSGSGLRCGAGECIQTINYSLLGLSAAEMDVVTQDKGLDMVIHTSVTEVGESGGG